MDSPSSDIHQSKPCTSEHDAYSCESKSMIDICEIIEAGTRRFKSLTKLRDFWRKYGAGSGDEGGDEATAQQLQMIRESEWKCFQEVEQVASALGRNNERGFELFEKRPKRDPIQIDNNGDPHTIKSGYRGEILMETLCRLAYIADPYEVSRVTITIASEMGGLPVCFPYLLPRAGMPNVADADDKAYWFFVHTLIAQTKELVELHTTEKQKQQISLLSQYSPRMTAEVCKAALAAAVNAYHKQWDTDWCGFRVEHAEAGVWADGNHPT